MKLIFITRESYKEPGARTRCYDFSLKLNKKGLNTEVFSFADKLGAKSGKDDVKFAFKEKLEYMYKAYKFLSKEADNSVFIVNRFNYHTIPVWIISFFRKIPFIFDMDDWEAREDIGINNLFPKSKAEMLTRLFAKNSLFCIAASKYLEDYLSQYNSKVYYIPTGVDLNIFYPSDRREKTNFVFSWHGSLNRKEIVEYIQFIMDCFLVLYPKYMFIRLYIAGDGIFKKELEILIKKYNCEAIVYGGNITHENIPAYLDKIDVGLVPLLDATKFNLSKSPVKLFEYMAKTKPVIVSPTGEAKHIIQNEYNGLLALNKDDFISCMDKLITDSSLCSYLGVNARKTIKEKYSLDVLGETLYKILIKNKLDL